MCGHNPSERSGSFFHRFPVPTGRRHDRGSRLPLAVLDAMMAPMNTKTQRSVHLPLAASLAAAIALVLLLAFRGWMENGAEMFLALAQSGLSWCF